MTVRGLKSFSRGWRGLKVGGGGGRLDITKNADRCLEAASYVHDVLEE